MNVAIVEDNTSSAKNLQSHLARFEKETGIDIRSSVYKDGIDFIANYASQWDLVLMDIEMPVLDGMHTAKKLRELDKDVLLIFVTQLAQYAISAFEVDAMDYMLKPVNYYAFYLKMQRVVHKQGIHHYKEQVLRQENCYRRYPLYRHLRSYALLPYRGGHISKHRIKDAEGTVRGYEKIWLPAVQPELSGQSEIC